jgi:predicted RNA methylase
MLRTTWDKIRDCMNDHTYMGEIDRDAYRIKATAEIFTPTDLVIRMLQRVNLNNFAPGKTVLDPACGDGQFLTGVKWIKVLFHKMSEEDALKDIYGVDIMRDNVELCKKRLGGGTILLGDALNPEKRIKDQSDAEHDQMQRLFLNQVTSFYV